MTKVKFILVWALVVFLFQETGLSLQIGNESLIEYTSEISESRKESVYCQVAKPEAKKRTVKKQLFLANQEPQNSYKKVSVEHAVKRSILYRTLLI